MKEPLFINSKEHNEKLPNRMPLLIVLRCWYTY